MKTERISGVEVIVEETFGGEQLEQLREQVLKKVASQVNIPGFRKGHAPLALVKNYVNPEYLEDLLRDDLLDTVLHEAAQEIKQQIYKVEVLEMNLADEGYVKAKLELLPTVDLDQVNFGELPKYEEPVVQEEEVNNVIDRLLEDQAIVRSVEVEKPEDGHMAEIEWALLDDQGNPLRPRRTTIEIGKEEFLEGTDAMLKEMTVGEERLMETPDKAAKLKIKLLDIKAKAKPELTDELAKSIGFENVEALRNAAEEEIRRYKAEETTSKWFEGVLDTVAQKLNVELPPSMVDEEYKERFDNFVSSLERQGLTLESYCTQIGKSIEEVQNDIRENVRRSLLHYLLSEVLRAYLGVKVEREEINEYTSKRDGISSKEAEYQIGMAKLIEALKAKTSGKEVEE
ncbi:trigger factor [Coprothermobacteraceae bacterium]|nr:trigger factor [Coprothermobacteraceae bacterium]